MSFSVSFLAVKCRLTEISYLGLLCKIL